MSHSIILPSPPTKQQLKELVAQHHWLDVSKAIHEQFADFARADVNQLFSEAMEDLRAEKELQEQQRLHQLRVDRHRLCDRFFRSLIEDPEKALALIVNQPWDVRMRLTEQAEAWDPEENEQDPELRECMSGMLLDVFLETGGDEAASAEWLIQHMDQLTEGGIRYRFPDLWEETLADYHAQAEETEDPMALTE